MRILESNEETPERMDGEPQAEGDAPHEDLEAREPSMIPGPASEDAASDTKPGHRSGYVGDAICCQPLEVKVYEGKMDKAIRMLKNKLAKEGVLKEIKRRRHYSKPSEQKRIKARDAARRRRKAAKIRRG